MICLSLIQCSYNWFCFHVVDCENFVLNKSFWIVFERIWTATMYNLESGTARARLSMPRGQPQATTPSVGHGHQNVRPAKDLCVCVCVRACQRVEQKRVTRFREV